MRPAFEAVPLSRGHRPERGSHAEAALVDEVFGYYRSLDGFPHVTTSPSGMAAEFDRLSKVAPLLRAGVIGQSMHGLTTANAYHPEMVSVRCRGFRTPMEVFLDDVLLREAILKRVRYGDNLKPWGIRKAIFSMRDTQRVSNFRPTAATTVIRRLEADSVLDPCAGWGGRLLGSLACAVPYLGIDPNRTAVENNRRMVRDMEALRSLPPTEIIDGCAEDVLPGLPSRSFPLVFTSPPYFDAEKYDTDPRQSYLRFPREDAWWEGFMRPLLVESARVVRSDGHVALNVNGNMADRVRECAADAGLSLSAEWKLTLSQHQYNKATSGTFRYEPVLVFHVRGAGGERCPRCAEGAV